MITNYGGGNKMLERPFVGTPTDYSMKEHWLALPDKPDKPVDLLCLYPKRGTVVVTEPRLKKCAITAIPGFKKLESVFGPESYHGSDYSFFYFNGLQRNISRFCAH